jgi:hypothetical protein
MEEYSTDEAVATVKANQGYEDGKWIRFHRHTWTSGEDFILYEWSNMFQGIGYCNNFIDDIQANDLSQMKLPVSKDQMIAEIKIMRAMYYYWALNDFGNIPIVQHVGEINPVTKPRAEVFKFIETEIKDNIDKLDEKGSNYWYGHWTKSAAHALLAKLYLNAEVFTGKPRWNDCIAECDAVLNSNLYTLDPTWDAPFKVHNETSSENIWVVPHDVTYAPGFNAAQEQVPGALKDKYNFVDYPWGKTVTQESFFNLYDTSDNRIHQWLFGLQTYSNGDPVMGWYDLDGQPFVITPHIDMINNPTAGYGQGVRNIKYEIEGSTSGQSQMQMNNDLVVFRLSDIMMMKAESVMRNNGGQANKQAVDLVNLVRSRSFDPANPAANYTVNSLTMDELLNERGREFAYEMKRREDLIRFGKFESAWWEKPSDADKKRELYPIPLNIITANPFLKQNDGY